MFHFYKDIFLGQGVIEQKGFSYYPSSYLIICHFLSSLPSHQTPEDSARLYGKHEAVKVLKEYAEVEV